MSKTSLLLFPRASLTGCVFAAIARDTRKTVLSDADRLNHFPASPFVALTYQHTGLTHLVTEEVNFKVLRQTQPLPRMSVAGPQNQPVTSWNSGAVFAVTVGFYPDAWSKLIGIAPTALTNKMINPVPLELKEILDACKDAENAVSFWEAFQDGLKPLWEESMRHCPQPLWNRQHPIADWAQTQIVRAATSGVGKSLRATQRRLRNWTGQNRQSLSFYAKFEELHRTVVGDGTSSLAGLAHQAGYSDQSHMTRAVRRATGFSPAHLNKLVATKEAFWCYRLLGERF